jgi:hypothetical protein
MCKLVDVRVLDEAARTFGQLFFMAEYSNAVQVSDTTMLVEALLIGTISYQKIRDE